MKKFLIVLLSLFLVGVVTAGIVSVSNIDKNLSVFTSEEKTALENKNLSDYSVTDYNIGIDYKERCLYKEDAINTCQRFKTYYMECTEYETELNMSCITEERVDYTSEQMEGIIDSWEEKRLKQIAVAEVDRQDVGDKTKVSEGVTTIQEKK